ncbi:MAG: hypothetical protein NVS3B20_19430 [Polyangiales bacterium]
MSYERMFRVIVASGIGLASAGCGGASNDGGTVGDAGFPHEGPAPMDSGSDVGDTSAFDTFPQEGADARRNTEAGDAAVDAADTAFPMEGPFIPDTGQTDTGKK